MLDFYVNRCCITYFCGQKGRLNDEHRLTFFPQEGGPHLTCICPCSYLRDCVTKTAIILIRHVKLSRTLMLISYTLKVATNNTTLGFFFQNHFFAACLKRCFAVSIFFCARRKSSCIRWFAEMHIAISPFILSLAFFKQ